MFELALTLLRYPDHTYAFQRRDESAPTSPEKLSLFGGHVEKGEQPQQAAKRELSEETSLDLTKYPLRRVLKVDVPEEQRDHAGDLKVYLFIADIPDADFEVYEGFGSERYSLEDFIKRNDGSKTAQMVIMKYMEAI